MKPPSPPRKENIRPNEIIKVIKQEPKDQGLKNIPVTPGNYKKFKGEERRRLPRGIFLGICGLIVLFIGGSIISFYFFRGKIADAVATNLGTLQAGVADLQNFDPLAAQQQFASLQNQPSDLQGLVGTFGFLFKGGADAISAFSGLTGQLTTLTGELATLQSTAFNFLLNGQGSSLIAELQGLQGTVNAIASSTKQLSGVSSLASGLSAQGLGTFSLSLQGELAATQNFLNAFVPWLAEPAPHHVLVFLDNPSEMRPGGGFLGSYADVTLADGNVTDISVHDIADADAAFTPNIVPPQPLQLITKRWRPADANWFFDFPTSASKTLSFFASSTLYTGSTTIDGAIAVSPAVVSDLLAITGPITIGHPTTTFTSTNFLVQIQKIVQDGQATDATYPKQILKDLSAALFTKLASSTDDEKQQMLSLALDWIANKDVMAYFSDPDLENFLDTYGASGAVYTLPQNFNGDYLAVVDANVGGGKSDLYVSSTVAYTAEINADGTLTGHVVVTRTHNGNTSPYWWYQTTNQDYLQLFLQDGTSLTNVSGGATKKIVAPVNYVKSGYSTDPTVLAVESSTQAIFDYPTITTHEESGKEVFATWSTVKSGASTSLQFDYTHRMFVPPAAGVAYQFVFEKEAGTTRHYTIEIDAPLGYDFAENGLSSYTLTTDDISGRLIVNLTLENLPQ